MIQKYAITLKFLKLTPNFYSMHQLIDNSKSRNQLWNHSFDKLKELQKSEFLVSNFKYILKCQIVSIGEYNF